MRAKNKKPTVVRMILKINQGRSNLGFVRNIDLPYYVTTDCRLYTIIELSFRRRYGLEDRGYDIDRALSPVGFSNGWRSWMSDHAASCVSALSYNYYGFIS